MNTKASLKDKKYVTLIKNIFIFGLGLVGSKLVQFILLPYFTNVLTTAEYGVLDLVVTFAGLMMPIVSLQLSDAILRFGLSKDIEKEDLFKNVTIILAFAVLISILLSPLLIFYKTIYPWRIYVVAIIVSQCIRINFALFVKADDRVITYSIDSILTALIVASSDILLILFMKMGIKGYFISEVLGNSFSILFLFTCGKIYQYSNFHRPLNMDLMKKMLKYSIPLVFNAISWWITSFSNRVILDLYFSSSKVGIYSVAAKIPAIITTLLSVFTQAWIMSAVKEYERERDVKFFEKVYDAYTCLLFPAVAGMIIVIKPIMKVYVGADFFEAWYYVPFLLVGTAFLGISNYYGAIYAAARANILEIKSTIICAVSNIILNLVLIPRFSIMGAAIATMMSYLIVTFVRIIDTRKILIINSRVTLLIVNFILLLAETICVLNQNNFVAAGFLVISIVINIWQVMFRKGGKIENINL